MLDSDLDLNAMSPIPSTLPKVRRGTQSVRLPMTPQQAIKEYGMRLTAFEKKEILEFPEIWYLGLEAKKIDGIPGGAQNCGYDDENGSYIKMLHDHIGYRYEIREIIGKGSFGQVVKVRERETDHELTEVFEF